MSAPYVLHYAPDNASQPVMIALEALGVPYDLALVDRRIQAQRGTGYLRLNPHGRIPVLETPDGPLFETAAILLWLADCQTALAPAPDHARRGDFLKWLFFASNTLHADLVMLFYAQRYVPPDALEAFHAITSQRISGHWQRIEAAAETAPFDADLSVLDIYLASLARWSALYPQDRSRDWFDLANLPRLARRLARIETWDALRRVAEIEGLGLKPFTAPALANPSIGSAT